MPFPTIAVTAPVRQNSRMIPGIVLEVGYQRGLELGDMNGWTLSPVDDHDRALERLARTDGLLLTGGEDIDPARYGAEPDGVREVSFERDALEFTLFGRALELGMPVLGICRGMQLINVALGGTLHQDLARDVGGAINHDRRESVSRPVHRLHVNGARRLREAFDGTRPAPNSSHHQGVDRLGEALVPVCWTADGLVEAFEYEDGGPWVVGVQWHPERMLEGASPAHRRLFTLFAEAVRAYADAR